MTHKESGASSAITSPRLPTSTRLPSVSIENIFDYQECVDLRLAQRDLSGQIADYPIFERMYCEGTNLSETEFSGLKCSDIRLTRCDLGNANWPKVIAHRAEIMECLLTGFQTTEGHFQNVVFKDCIASFARMRFATFKAVCFENCDLQNADFQGADLSGVVFAKCNLTGAQMSQTKLKGTDLRGSTIEGIRVGANELPGAIVDPVQAAYIAGLLGLVIKDEYENK